MIRFQIVERTGADLYHVLLHAMRSKELRTFIAARRGNQDQRRPDQKDLAHGAPIGHRLTWTCGRGLVVQRQR